MTLPPQLLNRVNKDLKAKVDQLGSDLQRQRALATLEAEVYSVTAGKVKDSKAQHANLEQLAGQNRRKLEELESEAQKVTSLLGRLRQDTETRKGYSRDLLTKLAAVETKVAGTRERLTESEKKSAENQQAALAWIDENKMTIGAATEAGSILAAKEAFLRKLKADAEAAQVQIKLVSELLQEESAATTEIQREIAEAKASTQDAQAEKHRMLLQMQELTQREEGLGLRHEGLVQRQRDLLAEKDDKARQLKQLQLELAAEMETSRRTEQAIQSFAAIRSRVELASKKLTSDMSEAELHANMTEQEIQITLQTIANKKRQVVGMTAAVQAAEDKLTKREVKVEVLSSELEKMKKENQSTEGETVAADEMVREYQRELNSLQQALDDGRYLLQNEIAKQRANADSTDAVSIDLDMFQRHLRHSDEKIRELSEKYSDLAGVADLLEVAVERRREEVAEIAAKHSEGNLAIREQRRAEVKQMEKELEFLERETLRTRKAVEAAQSAAYAHRRRLAEEDEYESDLARTMEELQLDIKTLAKDVESLFEKKVRAAEVADSAMWRLEALKQQAAHQHDGLVSQLTATGELEAAARTEEVSLVAERDGLLVELHAHEDERRKMTQRFSAAASRVSTLKSRYEDLMAALHRQVKEDVPSAADERKVGGGADVEVDWLTPAELQAKHLIQKAVERDQLQQHGDSLDLALVKAEQDLRLLDTAYSQLKQQMDSARQMIAEGRVELILDGYSATDEQEQQLFLEGLRAQFDEEASMQTELLRKELLLCCVEIAEKERRVAELKAAQNEKKELLASLVAKKTDLIAMLRQLQRQLQALESDTHEQGRSNATLAQTLLDKHRTAGARNPLLFKAVCDVSAARDTVEGVLQQLKVRVALSSQRLQNDSLYFAFREKCQRYGLNCDGDVSGATSMTHHPLPHASAKKSCGNALMPSASGRPATRALVQAMTDRTNDSARSLRHQDSASIGLCITNVPLQSRPKSSSAGRSSSASLDITTKRRK